MWLGNPYRNTVLKYSIKMQYKNVFKSDRWCSCYTCLPQTDPAAQTAQRKVVAPGTGAGAPPVAQRLLTTHGHKQGTTISIQENTNKS